MKGLCDTLYSIGITVQDIQLLKNPEYVRDFRSLSLKNKLSLLLDRRKKITDRAILVCQVTPEVIDEESDNYWNSTREMAHNRSNHKY